MGIAKAAYRLLLEEKKRGVLKGESILQLGRQCVLFDHAQLLKCAKKSGVPLTEVEPQLSFDSYHRKFKRIDDITLFKALGFKNVHSLDYCDFEGADIVCDLNHPVPEKYWGQFDVIYDGGTAEHVFNFPQVLRNIHLLLKEGGVIIHVSPSNNHVDHGFYMFSPQVYSEYYKTNAYKILTSHIFEYGTNPKSSWNIYPYEKVAEKYLGFGGFTKKLLGIHIVAQKTPHSTNDLIPQQGTYVNAWSPRPSSPRKKVDPITRLGISLKKKIKRRTPVFIKDYLARRKLRSFPKY